MAGSLGQLNISLTAETVQFIKAMDKAALHTDMNMRQMQRVAKVAGVAIAGALTAGATAFAVRMKQIIDQADELSKMSQKLGITTEQLSVLKHAADLAGVEFVNMATAVSRMSRTASDAANGLSTAKRAFDSIGVSVRDSNGYLRNADELLLDIADKFSKMADGTHKAALAQELFGRSGLALIPFLNEGREGFEAVRKEAERLGIILDSNTAKAAERFNDNLTRMQRALDGVFIGIAADVLPSLVDLTDGILKNKEKMDALRDSGKTLAQVFIGVAQTTIFLLRTIDDMTMAIGDSLAILHVLGKNNNPYLALAGPGIQAAVTLGKSWDEVGLILKRNAEESTEKWRQTFDLIGNMSEFSSNIGKEGVANGMEEERKKVEESLERISALMEEGRKVTESMRSPLEVLNDEHQRLNELVQAGAITQETYNRAALKAIATYDDQTKAIKTNNDLMRDLGATFVFSFEDAIASGEKFSEVLKKIEQDIIKLLVRKKITEPFVNALGEIKFDGFLGSIFSARGNVFENGNRVAKYFDSGGLINQRTTFPLSGGKTGVAGESGPEAILPLMRTSGGNLGVNAAGVSKTVVNVYAPPGSEVSEQRSNDGGMERIDIFIDEAVANKMSDPRSQTSRALRSNYGIGQRMISR